MRNCVVCGELTGSRFPMKVYCKACAPFVREIQSEVAQAMLLGGVPAAKGHACVDCGMPATDRDHRRYGKPLSVDYVCSGCNTARGPAADLTELVSARRNWKLPKAEPLPDYPMSLDQEIDSLEREKILQALEITRYNRTKAAAFLGITFRALRYRMARLELK